MICFERLGGIILTVIYIISHIQGFYREMIDSLHDLL